jgi:two-component system sensor histidine kinase VanS
MDRAPGLSVRLKLTLSYAGFLVIAGALLLALWVVLLQYFPHAATVRDTRAGIGGAFASGRSLTQRDFGQAAVAVLAFLLVFGLLGGWILAGRMLAPLTRITDATRTAATGSLSHRIRLPGRSDEFRELADAFDTMLAQLEAHVAGQQRFAANASHELRTPLAMMRTSLDVAIAKPGPVPAELTVLAGKLREGLDQADRLVENLLLLARAQHAASDGQETIPLGPLIAGAIDARAGLIASMGLHVQHTPGGDGTMVTGNSVLLAQMTANLIDNAVRHNHPGGWIRTQITRDGPAVRLLVENGGPLLDQDKVTTLTQPFRRLGTDHTGSSTGTGLGLSIAEAIATAHGGTLRLYARQEGGLQAVIDLPVFGSTGPPAQLAMAGGTR